MRENAGARGRLDQHLEAVGEEAGVAARPAVFDIVVDRMVVARSSLEGGELRLGDRSRRHVEAFADPQFVEEARGGEAVSFGREFGIANDAHGPGSVRQAGDALTGKRRDFRLGASNKNGNTSG